MRTNALFPQTLLFEKVIQVLLNFACVSFLLRKKFVYCRLFGDAVVYLLKTLYPFCPHNKLNNVTNMFTSFHQEKKSRSKLSSIIQHRVVNKTVQTFSVAQNTSLQQKNIVRTFYEGDSYFSQRMNISAHKRKTFTF